MSLLILIYLANTVEMSMLNVEFSIQETRVKLYFYSLHLPCSMKLFSNFNIKHRQELMSEYMQEYGDEKVFCVQKGSLYWYSFIFFPTLFYVLTLGVIIRFSYHGVDNIHAKYFLVGFVTLLFFLILIPIINKYISYKMDFLIVTPRSIAKYNQIGLFQNEIRTMNSDNIKTISIKKDGLLRSVFDSGDMVIVSDAGDAGEVGKIKISYVAHPENVRHTISHLIRRL